MNIPFAIISTLMGDKSSSSVKKRHGRAMKIVHLVEKKQKFMLLITFTDENFQALDLDQDDPMVITTNIAPHGVSKVLINQGSSINILYWKTSCVEYSENYVWN